MARERDSLYVTLMQSALPFRIGDVRKPHKPYTLTLKSRLSSHGFSGDDIGWSRVYAACMVHEAVVARLQP